MKHVKFAMVVLMLSFAHFSSLVDSEPFVNRVGKEELETSMDWIRVNCVTHSINDYNMTLHNTYIPLEETEKKHYRMVFHCIMGRNGNILTLDAPFGALGYSEVYSNKVVDISLRQYNNATGLHKKVQLPFCDTFRCKVGWHKIPELVSKYLDKEKGASKLKKKEKKKKSDDVLTAGINATKRVEQQYNRMKLFNSGPIGIALASNNHLRGVLREFEENLDRNRRLDELLKGVGGNIGGDKILELSVPKDEPKSLGFEEKDEVCVM